MPVTILENRFLRALVTRVTIVVALVLLQCSSTNPPLLGDYDAALGDGPGVTCGSSWHQGCPCGTDGSQIACGEVVRKTSDYVTCSEGQATCVNGTWGPCIGDQIYMKSESSITLGTEGLQTTPSACTNDPCDPQCVNFVDNGSGFDAGTGLTTTDAGGVTLAADGGTCSGLQCQVVSCGGDGGTSTTLTGTVYDPAGLNPIYHAYVYVPVGLPLPAIPTGAQMDPCGGGGTLPPVVSYFYTGPDGKFTLTNVPSGANIPLVVQAGKWRRMVMLSSVTACTTTAVPAANTRLPQNQTDGYGGVANLPQIAIATGSCDPMECLLKRIGISTTEFKNPGAGGRVDYYQAYGEPLSGGTNPPARNLLNNYTQMMKEDLIMLPCDCGSEYYAMSGASGPWSGSTSTYLTNIQNYTSNGGRLFTSHWARQWVEGGGLTNPFPGVANWINWWQEGGYDASWFEGSINTTFTKGADFASWQLAAGGSPSYGTLYIAPSRYDTYSVTAASRLWVSYTGRYTPDKSTFFTGYPNYPADFTFNTPVGAATQYGRVMYTDMHLASGFNTGSFPSECPTGGLTEQEKAAEFLLFDLGACIGTAPTPKIVYFPATFTVDYQGICPAGQAPVWRFFDWETVTPADSNIVFKAQEAATQAGLTGATPVVTLGTASGAPITTWTGTDVSTLITPSLAWLRVTITLNPTSDQSQAPTLTAWRQQYDCVDAQ